MNSGNEIGFRQLFDRDTWTYTYMLFDPETLEGVIIDPVKEKFERDLQLLEELGIELKYVMDTHVHADHVTAAGLFREMTGAKTSVGEPSGVPCADLLLQDGDELEIGQHRIQAISTPGHTDACTTFKVNEMLFTGDTLFIRGCGRTDFQQGDPKQLFESISQKLYCFPDETRVFPGHDYQGRSSSTIGEEKRFNPRIHSEQTQEEFVRIMNSLNLKRPAKIDEAVPANLSCGMSSTIGHGTEENFSMVDLHRILGMLKPEERVVDVRTPGEYAMAHVPKSLNVPMGGEQEFIEELRNYDKVYLYCHSGRRAQTVYTILSRQGLDNLVCICSSGMADWIASGFPVNRGEAGF